MNVAIKLKAQHVRIDLSGWVRQLPDWWSCWINLPMWH